MRRHIFFLSIFFLQFLLANAQPSGNNCYSRFQAAGEKALKNRDFDDARNQFNAALECPGLNAEQRNSMAESLKKVNLEITREDREARKKAEEAKQIAEQNALELAAAKAETERLLKLSKVNEKRATGNELGFKATIELSAGDRTAAFRLAEFIEKYTDPGNAKAAESLLSAAYFNNDPRNHDKLGWLLNTLVESSEVRFTQLVFSNDGERLGAVNEQGQVKIWEILSGRVLLNWSVVDPLAVFKFSPALDAVAISMNSGKFFVLDVATGATRFSTDFEKSQAVNLQFSPDGRRVGLIFLDRSVRVLDANENHEIFKIRADTMRYGIHFSEDLQHLAVISNDEKLRIYHLPEGNLIDLGETGRYIFATTFSPDGKYLACSTEDREILLFNSATGVLLGKFTTLRDAVTARLRGAEIREAQVFSSGSPYKLEFSNDGGLLTAFFADRTALAFSVSDGSRAMPKDGAGLTLKNSFESSFPGLFDAQASGDLVLFNDGPHLEILGHGIENVEPGAQAELLFNDQFEGPYQQTYLFSPNERRFALAKKDGRVLVHNVKNDVFTLLNLNKAAEAKLLTFSPDSRFLAIARENGAVEIWDASGEEMSFVLPKLAGQLENVRFSEDGKLTGWLDETGELSVTQNSDDSVLFKIQASLAGSAKMQAAGTPLLHFPADNLVFDFSPDGEHLLVFGRAFDPLQRDTIYIIGAKNGLASGEVAQKIYFSNLVTANFEGGGRFLKIRNTNLDFLFDVKTGLPVAFLPKENMPNIRVSDGGEWVAFKNAEGIFTVETSSGRRVFSLKNDFLKQQTQSNQYNLNQQTQSKQYNETAEPDPNYFLPLDFSPDGKKLLLQTDVDKGLIVNTLTWQVMAEIGLYANYPPRFAPGGQHIVSLSYNYLYVWDAENGRLLTGMPTSGLSPVVSKNGQWLAVPQENNKVVVFDFSLMEERLSLRGHRERISEMAFSVDGKMLATASADHTIKCWSMETGREIFSVSGGDGSVSYLEFSPDGQMLLAVYGDEKKCVWAISSPKILQLALRNHHIAALSEDQIYRFNLEQAFLEKKPDEALADMEPAIQLGFARYFGKQAAISLDPKVYQDLYNRADLFFKTAISNLDSEVALRELAKMRSDWALNLRRDSMFSESRKVASLAVEIYNSMRPDDVKMLIERGFAEGLAGDVDAASASFFAAIEIDKSAETEVSSKVSLLSQKGDDREKWVNFWPAFEENNKLSSIGKESGMGVPSFFELSAARFWDAGEYDESVKSAISELIFFLSDLHESPSPVGANMTAKRFGDLSWYYLFTKNGTKNARRFATAGLALDSTVLFIHANLGHAALLDGDFDAATKIYDRWQDEWYEEGDRFFREAILDDLEKFAKAGKRTWTPLISRAAQRILGEKWNDEEEKRFLLPKEKEPDDEKTEPKPEKQRKAWWKF